MSFHLDPAIVPVGCFDNDIDLFESQYAVPNGVSYNSYVILDEKVAVLDTVDPLRNGWTIWTRPWRAVRRTTWWSTTWSPTTPGASRFWRRSSPA